MVWLKVYKDEGIEAMLIGSKPRKAKKRKISKEVHAGLFDKLNNSFEGFRSYIDAVDWLKRITVLVIHALHYVII